MPDTRTKALGYLRSGNVRVLRAASHHEGPRRPHEVTAHVDGHRSVYLVEYRDGAWSCTCRDLGCAHLAAVQLVTGHPSAAAKPGGGT